MSRRRGSKKRTDGGGDGLLTQRQIIQEYGVSKNQIHRYFPKPQLQTVRMRNGAYWNIGVWPREQVEKAIQHPEIAKSLEEKRSAQNEQKQIAEIPGTYLGPLRLLALEMYDKINAAGIPCSMLTGEESIQVENAQIVSSTIELCDCNSHFKTAVIDEAQLIADPSRGASWLRAICLVNADVVHICMAPEALKYIEELIQSFGDHYSVVRHERLAPLRYGGICTGYKDLRPDDALICFSRKSVLSTAALLEKNGFRASVIYGALPPEARRNEVRKYTTGETNIVVATDAIGLGISLPIKRVVFAETEKYDGKDFRPLTTAEINQIGGRAGRYGLNEYGEVMVLGNKPFIGEKLGQSVRNIRAACIAFPREVLETEYPIALLLKTWQRMEQSRGFVREDMHDAQILLNCLKGLRALETERELVFDLITCPVDTRTEELVTYWAECARAILRKRRIPAPYFGTETLQDCELQYKAYDIRHQLLRRIGIPDDCTAERSAICERIAELMRENKDQYIRRCRVCGKELPIGSQFNICEDCFARSMRKI